MHSITILHEDGQIKTYTKDLPHFVYTDDMWESSEDIILSAVFALIPGDKKMLWQRAEEAALWREKEAEKRRIV